VLQKERLEITSRPKTSNKHIKPTTNTSLHRIEKARCHVQHHLFDHLILANKRFNMADEAISMFTELTGASPGQAQQYLSLADDNVEQAIQLFFETGGSLATEAPQTSAPPQSAPRPPPSRSRAYAEDEDGVVHLDSDDEEDDFDMGGTDEAAAPQTGGPSTEDDEAMARRLQQELYAGAGRDPEGVRAPIARQTETLVGPGSAPWAGDEEAVETMIAQHNAARVAARAQRAAGASSRMLLRSV
jgi:hypothetical protein